MTYEPLTTTHLALLGVPGSSYLGRLGSVLVSSASDPTLRGTLGRAAKHRVMEDFRPDVIWQGIDSALRGEVSEHVFRI